nr:hypothetical protein [uncultured Dyadobacter sp.]
MDLNSRTKVNTLHISLNFAAEDKLDKASLTQIAGVYLDKIGFASRPICCTSTGMRLISTCIF